MAAAAAQSTWPYDSLIQAPTNLKEAIDWVLRVTGKDGKKNEKPQQQQQLQQQQSSTNNGPHCLCYLAKAVKDLLYDAKDPGSPGPSPDRNWDNLLLEQEKTLVLPVLTDLGLLSTGSTSATSSTCSGGTEVIGTLIDQLALGLQKWVGWKEGDQDECCLKGDKGIGKKCDCPSGVGAGCCTGGTKCHECSQCGTNSATNKCYLSAYCKKKPSSGSGNTEGDYYWPTLSDKPDQVHLLARIFLGSVCLIWSGLSQLGFLTGGSGSGNNEKRWKDGTLSKETENLGSFMAAMGYDLDRLNQGSPPDKKGQFVHKLLSGKEPDKDGIKWQEFKNGEDKSSVAEYYSSIYSSAKTAVNGKLTTEKICEQYPLLVLHILASGYFRAGSAGAKGITVAPKAALKKDDSDSAKKENTPRKPRTIREILYWLSALPYSEKYRELVERMGDKYPRNEKDPQKAADEIKLYDERAGPASTTLKKDHITHYLMAACGYCPLVLIGIQGTINTSGSDPTTSGGGGGGGSGSSSSTATDKNKCPNHKEIRHERCKLGKDAPQASAPGGSTDGQLQPGQVCYGGYHLDVSKFGPLHGMYANGLFGFQMDGSPAQCLDQLRVYVYHCFYQLYFLRKQCGTGVVAGDKAVLGWKSCRYGSGVAKRANDKSRGTDTKNWMCKPLNGGGQNKCNCLGQGASQGQDGSKDGSPLQSFLCDSINGMHCQQTVGRSLEKYPEIDAHMNKTIDSKGIEHQPHKEYPQICPVPMGWSKDEKDNHFKDLTKGSHKTEPLQDGQGTDKYPAHCTGNTLSHLLEYYCDPASTNGTLVLVLRLLACITPTVPRTLGDLFGFYYYIVYIGGKSGGVGQKEVNTKLTKELQDVRLSMLSYGDDAVVTALGKYGEGCNNGTQGTLKCLYKCDNSGEQCSQYLCPLSGQQYGQLSPAMAGTYLSWLVYLIGEFKTGLEGLRDEFTKISCTESECKNGAAGAGCNGDTCRAGSHGTTCNASGSGSAGSAVGGKGGSGNGVCGCASVVSCTGVLPVLYKYGFGYGNVTELHKGTQKKCHQFLTTLTKVEGSTEFSQLTNSINQLIYTTRLPWIFVLTVAWLVAVLYLAFGAIWPLDWTHMRSHCRGWFRKGSLSPWEILMVGKKKGRSIVEYFGKT